MGAYILFSVMLVGILCWIGLTALGSESRELHRVPVLHESLQEFVLDLAEKPFRGVQQPSPSRKALLNGRYSAGFLKWGLRSSEYFEICPTIQGTIVLKFYMGHLD